MEFDENFSTGPQALVAPSHYSTSLTKPASTLDSSTSVTGHAPIGGIPGYLQASTALAPLFESPLGPIAFIGSRVKFPLRAWLVFSETRFSWSVR